MREQLAWWRDLEGNGAVEAAAGAMGIGPLLDIAGGLLSAGQRRRLALARLALAETPVWLLDEPAVSLDEDGVALLLAMIGRHRARGGLVIVATHQPAGLPDARTVNLGRDAPDGADGP